MPTTRIFRVLPGSGVAPADRCDWASAVEIETPTAIALSVFGQTTWKGCHFVALVEYNWGKIDVTIGADDKELWAKNVELLAFQAKDLEEISSCSKGISPSPYLYHFWLYSSELKLNLYR